MNLQDGGSSIALAIIASLVVQYVHCLTGLIIIETRVPTPYGRCLLNDMQMPTISQFYPSPARKKKCNN